MAFAAGRGVVVIHIIPRVRRRRRGPSIVHAVERVGRWPLVVHPIYVCVGHVVFLAGRVVFLMVFLVRALGEYCARDEQRKVESRLLKRVNVRGEAEGREFFATACLYRR